MKSKVTGAIGIMIFTAFIVWAQRENENLVRTLAFVSGGLFLFSFLVRRNIHFKPYFTNKYNFLTSKIRRRDEIDIRKDTLFDKMAEVLSEAGFKVRYTDKEKGTLFATSRMSFSSWGENIYIDMTEKNGKTLVDFCSASFFGVVSWGRNEKNYKDMLATFENSLTI